MGTEYYLNNVGASLMSPRTVEICCEHLQLEASIGSLRAATAKADEVAKCYSSLALMLNAANASEIAWCDSASRAWDAVLYGSGLKAGDRVLTLSSEFGTNLVSIYHYTGMVGASVVVLPCDTQGTFSLDLLEEELAQGVAVVAISHAAAHGSILNPVQQVGELCQRYGARYIVDGCQAVGQLDIDVRAIACDVYTGTGRKWLRGPRGTGFLYVRSGSDFHTPFVDLASADLSFDDHGSPTGVIIREDARRFELWERSIASVLGLGNAVSEYLAARDAGQIPKIFAAATSIRTAVQQNPKLTLFGRVDTQSGIVGLYATDPADEVRIEDLLQSAHVVYSTMADWDCPLHFPKNGIKKIFRLAPHYYTPPEGVTRAIEAITAV